MDYLNKIKNTIRTVNDFPKEGIIFRDITPVLSDSDLCKFIIEHLSEKLQGQMIDAVVGIESRGFLFGLSLAQKLGVGFIPARKKGKLPYETISFTYALEYGTAEVEIHKDSVKPGMRIHIHDDLIATGGTAQAVANLILQMNAEVQSFSFLVELAELEGRKKISKFSKNIEALIVY